MRGRERERGRKRDRKRDRYGVRKHKQHKVPLRTAHFWLPFYFFYFK